MATIFLYAPIAQARDVPPAPPADASTPAAGAQDSAQDSAHGDPVEQPKDVIVSAVVPQSERDVLSGTSVLTGAELTRALRPTIGETLARLPGVSATSFGPNASRPILRGFQGERIRVLTDGIGSIDVSNTSVDHAVAINPLLAERVEVLRGPAALLFGSSAIGGVVNVIDTRIPRRLPENGVLRLNAIAGFGSAATERSFAAAADVKATGNLVLHVDGSYLASDNVRIGGFALTPQQRAQALASARLPLPPGADPIDFAANAAIRGTLPNTRSETWNVGAGASIITDTGSFGLSYSRYASRYGLPIRYATAPGQEQEAPVLDVAQDRVDFRAQIDAHGPVIDQVRLRAGYASYRHFELEDDGSIGTSFFNKGFEGRLEVLQAKRGVWNGASGVQFFNREFNVLGKEAFVPRSATAQTGIFTQQQLDFGPLKVEAGARYEWSTVDSRVVAGDRRFPSAARGFGAFSGSVGASYALGDNVRIGLNGSRTERAPSAEELFANGPHKGTQTYELGNANFTTEKSWGLEATLHVHGDGFNFDASAYYNWFDNFIVDTQVAQAVCEAAAAPSGRDVELPCFQFVQRGARFWGLEASGSMRVAQVGNFTINVDALADYVQASLNGQGPVPRIPAGRVLAGVEAQSSKLNGRIEVENVFAQNRVAAFETRTSGYTMVNASIELRPFASERTSLLLSANNLFDVDARRHASFIKDFAPLPGRDIRLTLKFGI
ncbi:TonB-dependent receptor [Sphingomonas sp.]|uniref:TonB-dependent receptor n=1 Tax=Sphingomonas sp. TaxID=28214 RepID=UPI001DFBC77D|nr:TonB-dependent receptor [Sphingomonas sp.]MBX9796790.1 TonB-dependent receptor [Sphingomonas sp.]